MMDDRNRDRSGDLDTLLRDAGRAPTFDLDVDEVHARGRRRALVRRVAAGAGALALVGVAGLGVANLLEQPDVPFVEEAPSEQPADRAPDEGTDEGVDAEAADQALSARLGVVTHRLFRERFRTRVVRATPEAAYGRLTDAVGAGWPHDVHVTGAGDVWFVTPDGALLVLPAGDAEEAVTVAVIQQDLEWSVLGTDGEGQVLVGRTETDGDGIPRMQVVRTDGASLGEEVPGIDVTTSIGGDPRPFAVVMSPTAPERVVVLDNVGESYAVTVLRQGEGSETVLMAGGLDHWLSAIALVDGELWVLESGTDGEVDLLVLGLDGGDIRRVATPLGREADGYTTGLSAASGPDGPVVVLGAADDRGDSWSYLVDPAAVDAAATPSEPMVPGPSAVPDAYERLDLPGRLLVTPLAAEDTPTGPLAACATDGDGASLNARPLPEQTVLYYLCWDAMAQLPEEAAHPFVPEERDGTGVLGTRDELLALLREWADGPSAAGREAGLTGGLDPEVATIADVTVDGTQVTVDLAPGEQVGVLGTTTGGAVFTQAVVGNILQFDAYESVRFTLDGSCEDFGALVESLECRTHDESVAPWAQAPPS